MSKQHRFVGFCFILILANYACVSNENRNGNSNNAASGNQSTRPAPTPVPTVTPAPIAALLVSEDDAYNDVIDGDGRKPSTTLPGIDLVAVQLEKTGSEIKATFKASNPFPGRLPSGTSAIWQISICGADGNKCNLLGAKLIASEWTAFIYDMTTNRNLYVQKPTVSGNNLSVGFPLSDLPNLRMPSNWWADSEYNGKWEDRVPDKNEAKFPAP